MKDKKIFVGHHCLLVNSETYSELFLDFGEFVPNEENLDELVHRWNCYNTLEEALRSAESFSQILEKGEPLTATETVEMCRKVETLRRDALDLIDNRYK